MASKVSNIMLFHHQKKEFDFYKKLNLKE